MACDEPILTCPDDWDEFDSFFQHSTIEAKIWDKIDPDLPSRKPFLSPPYPPEVTMSPRGKFPSLSGTTSTENEHNFKRAWQEYERSLVKFRHQQLLIWEALEWLWKNVARRYMVIACENYEGLDVVYKRLRAMLRPDPPKY